MGDRTDAEKEVFGQIPLQLSSATDVERAIETYLVQICEPNELLGVTVEQSRDRFLRELSKFEAEFEMRRFFSDEGVKDRKETIKLKVLMGDVGKRKNTDE